MVNYFFAGCLFWGGIVLCVSLYLYTFRPQSNFHKIELGNAAKADMKPVLVCCLLIVSLCVMPMSLSSGHNGKRLKHGNQYELLAESFLKGRVDIKYDEVDPGLAQMENPYDPEARARAQIKYHWDHAWYKGRYYMYFGVVPVLVLFVPYRLITGSPLMTYHATQLFAALTVAGMFSLFYQLSRKFFPEITLGMYIALSSSLSVMSIWTSIAAPVLYCTAHTAGICMEVWSFFFLARALTGADNDKQRIRSAFLGTTLGALAFGCRPPAALANFIVIPFLFAFVKKERRSNHNPVRSVFLVMLPYIVVGAMLMWYNYCNVLSITI